MRSNIIRPIVIVSCGIVLIVAAWRINASQSNANIPATPAEYQQYRKAQVAAEQRAELRQLNSLPQPFSKLLISMNRGDQQLGTDGALHPAHKVGVTVADGMYLYDLVRKTKPQRTAEVGFAEGFSTLYILAGLQANGNGMHVAIDPFETSDYYGVGLARVKDAGMDNRFRFLPERSFAGLPELAAEKKPYNIVFIDGAHIFDFAFTDFMLSDSLCPEGGYILFHDIWMPSTKKIVSFIEHNRRDYVHREVPEGVNIAVFQKVRDVQRPWDHFVDF